MPDDQSALRDAIQSCSTRRTLKSLIADTRPGQFGPALFEVVVRLSGSDPGRAIRLATLSETVRTEKEDRPWILRAQGVGLRARAKWSLAAQRFVEAGEAANGIDQVAFQIGAIDSFARAGTPDRAIQLGTNLFARLKKLKRPDLAGRAALNVGNAYLWTDDEASASEWLRRAAELLPEDSVERTHALLGRSSALLHTTERALSRSLAEEALAAYQASESEFFAALSELNLAVLDRLDGDAEASLTRLLRLRPMLSEGAFEAARVEEFMGDAYLDLGLWTEAQHAFQVALSLTTARSAPLNQTNCLYGRAKARRSLSDPLGFLRDITHAERRYRALGNPYWADRCLLELCEAGKITQRSALRLQQALSRFQSQRLDRETQRSQLVLAEWGVLDPFKLKITDPSLEYRLHALRAAQSSTPLPHYRKMLDSMARDRVRRKGAAALSSYFLDKREPLEAYLLALLSSGQRSHLDEAMDVIRKTRSIALLDEIMAAGTSEFSEDLRQEIDSLRQEMGPESDQPGSRVAITPSFSPSLRRKLTEVSQRVVDAVRHPAGAPKSEVLFATDQALVRLNADGAESWPTTRKQLLDLHRKWMFEVRGERSAQSNAALDRLAQCYRELLPSPGSWICPADALWTVPWPILNDEPSVLCLHPDLTGDMSPLPSDAKGVILLGCSDDLVHLQSEVMAIRELFPAAKVFPTAKEARAWLQSGESVDFVHVAGHARFDPENPMFSHLVFSDGLITGAEISRSSFRTRLAVLNACDTGCLDSRNPYEPDGLVRAFLTKGASAVIAGLWPLDDAFARDFARSLYQSLRTRVLLNIAVAEARNAVRQVWPGPQHWGGIVLFGGYHHEG